MKKIEVSAPGKLMLLGEHAVVYNKPCLVTAIDQRFRLTIEVLNVPEFQLNAPDIDIVNYKKQIGDIGKGVISKGAKFVEIAVKNFLDISAKKNFSRPLKTHLNPPLSEREAVFKSSLDKEYQSTSSPDKGRLGGVLGLKITTKSEFSSKFGFGSSAASTVCTIKAMSELFNLNLTPKEIFNLSYRTILDVQSFGSGFDAAAAVYGGTIYFTTGGKAIEPLAISRLPLAVGYSGIKADTVTLINQVKEKTEKYPKIIEGIYSSIGEIVELAKVKLLANNLRSFGELMNINQGYLEALGVSNTKLVNMIYAARIAGAYGAKLSGAGGGDCVIALAPATKRKAVEKAIIKTGGEVIEVNTNAEGVRVEK